MIWHSTFAMTVIDVLIVSIAGYTLSALYKHKRDLREPTTISGVLLIAVGVALFGAFYSIDLFAMHGLPLFIPREAAMAAMQILHLNASWFFGLAGMGSIVAGFLLNNKHMLSLIDRLERTQRGLVEEVAERKRAEEAMGAAKEQADLANRTKSDFLANMSHELRTPLNAIIGFSELMRDGTLGPIGNPKYLEYSRDINESGTHLLALINDILDLSKIEAGKVELHEDAVAVAEAVETCLYLVKARAETAGVKLTSEIADDLPPLYADERKLKQILINLLSNAAKFTPAGGSIDLIVDASDREGFTFTVSDTGIGIAPDDIPKVLLPFVQVENALTRKYEGTGLGLPLTKSLAELHGGSLDVQSEIGVGTMVTVRFPTKRIARFPFDTQSWIQPARSQSEIRLD